MHWHTNCTTPGDHLLEGAVGVSEVPGRAEDVEWLGEHIVVHHPSVDREQPHEENDVATIEQRKEHLWVCECRCHP